MGTRDSPFQVTLSYRSDSTVLSPPLNATGEYLFDYATKVFHLPPSRVRIVYQQNGQRVVLEKLAILTNLPVRSFQVRDLGPQFSYSGVFALEYLGPFLLWMLLTAILRPPLTPYVSIASALWLGHYTKRLLETRFVHIFSHATMPLFNLFKNSIYYWGFALVIAWRVARAAECEVTTGQIAAVPFFVLFEALNLYCHIALRRLRPPGSTERFLPRGFLFDSIACPNYTAEILSWVSFAAFVRVWPAWLFAIFGAVQMFVWADKKRKELIKKFPQARLRGRITPFRFL
jgi:very-long-chain enoyl-CoA reductase